jgi:hypothetical protein
MQRAFFLIGLGILAGVAGCGGGSSSSGTSGVTQFVGETEDGTTSVALVRIDGRVNAYACNDADVGEWFEADDSQDLDELPSSGPARLTLDAPAVLTRGAFIDAAGHEHPFRTRLIRGDEGLYLLFGDDLIDLSATPSSDVTLEQILHTALVERLALHRGVSDGTSFRAGWIVGRDGRIVGNITLPRSGLAPVGNLLPLDQAVLTGTTLSVRRLEGRLTFGTPLEPLGKPSAPDVPQSATSCGDNFELSTAGCCNAIRFNQVLALISNGLTDLGLESEAIDTLLTECAETLTDFCVSVNANACPR